jgi:hypothetical protein
MEFETHESVMLHLPFDILLEICVRMFAVHSAMLFSTCKFLKMYDNDDTFETIAFRLYSAEFWRRAMLREQSPCSSWKLELLRIDCFQARIFKWFGEPRWDEASFFEYWESERNAQRDGRAVSDRRAL